jgi:hypothetical protein
MRFKDTLGGIEHRVTRERPLAEGWSPNTDQCQKNKVWQAFKCSTMTLDILFCQRDLLGVEAFRLRGRKRASQLIEIKSYWTIEDAKPGLGRGPQLASSADYEVAGWGLRDYEQRVVLLTPARASEIPGHYAKLETQV